MKKTKKKSPSRPTSDKKEVGKGKSFRFGKIRRVDLREVFVHATKASG